MLDLISSSVSFSDSSVTYMTPLLVAIGMISVSPRVRVCMVTKILKRPCMLFGSRSLESRENGHVHSFTVSLKIRSISVTHGHQYLLRVTVVKGQSVRPRSSSQHIDTCRRYEGEPLESS
jgi:hypothetical protein